MRERSSSSVAARDMARYSLFTVLIIIGTFTKIPIYVVPFTLQFLFTNMAALMLDRRGVFISIGLYILLGLIGIPVFSGGGGIGYLIRPTFGYILGFLIGGYLAARMIEKVKRKSFGTLFAASLVNLAVIYLLGVTYYYWITKLYAGSADLWKMIWGGALIFLPVDIASAVLGVMVALRIGPKVE